jgi:glycosyltransferase involved in cell wall biosynthesis
MKVSIITVCFNSAKYINSAIRSVLDQNYNNIEYIIIDGGSNDETISIIESYTGKVDRVVSEPDNGIYDAMNKGVMLATGDIIVLLNSDDYYYDEDVVTNVVKWFTCHPSADVVIGSVDFVHANNLSKPVRLFSSMSFSPWKMRYGFGPAHPAAFIRRSAYGTVGLYSDTFKNAGDFDWFLRAFLVHGLTYVLLDKTLVRMRDGGVSTSGWRSWWVSSNEILKSLKRNKIYSNLFFVLVRLPFKYFNSVRLPF